MLKSLENHNDDIKRLIQKGYAVALDSSCLVIRDVPYLDENKNLQIGAMVSKLIFEDKVHVHADDHQMYFCGSHPCQQDGSRILNLGGGLRTLPLKSPDLIVQRSFSNKPAAGFSDLFDKMESYATIICGPAMALFPEVTPLTFREYETVSDSVFHFNDTLTSRAGLGDLATKFQEDIIAIIGLGGTGSYILDFLAKTPVKEIRGFDLDKFHVHNAFRSPGKLDVNELNKTKAEVYQQRYGEFRTGINIQSKYIVADSLEDLEGVSFAFVSVDKGKSREGIFKSLVKMEIPFIDVGMGLDRDTGPIGGMLRMTYYPKEDLPSVFDKNLSPLTDDPNDIYRTNIQISELNALNACLAVIKYKQLRGFYVDDTGYYHQLLNLHGLKLFSEE